MSTHFCVCGKKLLLASPIPTHVGWFRDDWAPFTPPVGTGLVLVCSDRQCFEMTGSPCMTCLPGQFVRTYRAHDESRLLAPDAKDSADHLVCPVCKADFDACPRCGDIMVLERTTEKILGIQKGLLAPMTLETETKKCIARGCGFKRVVEPAH